ncbi:MAG TPA: two-component regulator propeller domain-containing protein [Thermoanaerobaculia bacterium]
MHCRRWIPLLAAVVVALPSFALDPNRLVTQYVRRSWSVRQGLPQDSIQALAQTADGYMWIGTAEGLARYDGTRFEIFNTATTPQLKANNIVALHTDRSGTLWIGTARGVTMLREGRFEFVRGTDALRGVFGIASDEKTGTMWFGASLGGVQRYENGRLNSYAKGPSAVYKLARTNGVVWAGAAEGLYRIDGSQIARVDAVPAPVVSIVAEGDRLWLGTMSRGLLCLRNGRLVNPNPIPLFDGQDVWALHVDRQGNLWIGARTGLWRRTADGQLSRLGTAEGLSHDYVDSIHEDDEGSLWVGTHVAGLNHLRDGFILPETKLEGLSSSTVWTVTQDRQGTMWAGTEGGLNRLDGKSAKARWTSVAASTGLHQTLITSAIPARAGNGIWVGTYGQGVHLMEGDRVVRTFTQKDGLPSPFVVALFVDRQGSLWVGTMGGVARQVDGRFIAYGPKDGVRGDIVPIITEDKDGRVWVSSGGGSGGPAVFDGTRFSDMYRGRKLPSESAGAIAITDDGDLWLSTLSGLMRIHGAKTFSYTAAHGLPAPAIVQIVEDRGSFWLASAAGLCHVSRQELDAVMNGTARTVSATVYGAEDGMPGQAVLGITPGAWKSSDGRIWFATSGGLAVVDPRAAASAPRLRPRVEDVRVNGRPFEPRARVELKDARDRLEFRYTAPSFADPREVRFRHRLVGFDRGWVDAGDRRIAEYTNLPAGDYEFRVRASSDGKSWTPSSTGAVVRRLPAIHETWWFVALCTAAVTALIWFVDHRRMRALQLRHEAIVEERKRIALEIHDTFAQGLSATIMRIDSALGSPSPERAAEHLQIGKSLVRATLADARRALDNLRSASLENGDLAEALGTMIESLTKGLPVTAGVEVIGTRRRLRSAGMENHLLRIGQEAITNALRHANASSVSVTVEYRPESVLLQVRDDGRGVTLTEAGEAASNGHGLRGMRERAERIGATMTARRHPEGGFEIAVEAPG